MNARRMTSGRFALERLQSLRDRWGDPCRGKCEHAHCPLLRALDELIVHVAMEVAREDVRPIVERELEGERRAGEIMDFRLRSPSQPRTE